REIEGILEPQIQPNKSPQPPCLVALPDEVPVLVQLRERKPSVHVKNRDKVQLVRQANDAPEEPAVGCIGRHRPELVGANQRIPKIPKELVVIIQFTSRSRAHVTRIYGRPFRRSPAQHPEELPIGLLSRIEEPQLRARTRLIRIQVEVAVPMPALVSEA